MWLTSDTHFGHANIIEYSSRPYPDVPVMDATLIDNWNDRVRPTDEVWHLGDVVMGKAEQTLELIRQLHGVLYLVAGNHDRCWPGHRKVGSWPERYTDVGFTLLPAQTTLQLAGQTVGACHFPYVGDSHDQDRYAAHRPADHGQWLLHGHVHEAWRQRGRMVNVGVDVWDYAPVHADTVAALVAAGPRDLDRHGQPTPAPLG